MTTFTDIRDGVGTVCRAENSFGRRARWRFPVMVVVMVVPAVIVRQVLVAVVQPAHVDAGHVVQVRVRRVVVVVQLGVPVRRETIHRPGLGETQKQKQPRN